MTTKARAKKGRERTGGPYPAKIVSVTSFTGAVVKSWRYVERDRHHVVVEVRTSTNDYVCTAIIEVPR